MKGHLWICVLGLLCMPAEAILQTWTVSQRPLSVLMRVNSSAEITCSTSLPEPMGLYLRRLFRNGEDVVYLDLKNGRVTKRTTAPEFMGRIEVTPHQQIEAGCGFTLRLSLLGLGDTDLYYCTWSHFKSQMGMLDTQSSNGTLIIVTETDPQEQCKVQIFVVILMSLSVLAFTILLVFFVGALILKCTRLKKHFRPAKAVAPRRPYSPQHVCPQYRSQHSPYMSTTASTLDFRGIL
ncbi:T-cell antigen CD7 [Scophthalmus maximus]|uniref:T-cell antigen CD7 n=1 Tax=Scophthalmus maximus TaxID=52904 RepID=UPI001FA8E770|nr:T-cell antigen CD7 [Scophthalmus maximus]XP_035469466.2 T-cell antigen CD7 [Scophthalmus maximus]